MKLGEVGLFVFGLFGLLPPAVPAQAAIVTFRAELNCSNVVPPNNQSGTGYLEATLDTASKVLTWHGSYSKLAAKRVSISFRGPASPDESAEVIFSVRSLFGGSATLTDKQAANLIAGHWYILIRSRTSPRVEIRGQIVRGR